MSKVDFFIAGAPKCGTSSLGQYLNRRQDVYMSNPKEPHYFALDFPKYRQTSSLETYNSLFDNIGFGQLVGEASVFYLYSEKAIQLIHDYNEKAKIIIMLRKPADLVYSLHSQLLFTHDEDVTDFREAWNLCADRRENRKVPPQCREPKLLLYDEIAGFKVQIERLLGVFPRESICFVFFQDFADNTAEEYRRVCRFLNLPEDREDNFPVINKNRRHRSWLTSRLLYKESRRLRRPVNWIKRVIGVEKFGVLTRLRQLERKYEERPPLEKNFQEMISEHYETDVAFVEKLLDRNLSTWRTG